MSTETIKHDEEWLNDCRDKFGFMYGNDDLTRLISEACQSYHEHMTRWRPLTEFPEDGERVQIVCKITMRLDGEERILSHIKVFHRARGFEKGDAEYICWRPVPLGDLPDTEIISGESES